MACNPFASFADCSLTFLSETPACSLFLQAIRTRCALVQSMTDENTARLDEDILLVEEMDASPEGRLGAACDAGDIISVRRLLESGVNPRAGFPSAAGRGHIEVLELLFEHGLGADRENLLEVAVKCEASPAVLKFLIGRGYYPYHLNENKLTPSSSQCVLKKQQQCDSSLKKSKWMRPRAFGGGQSRRLGYRTLDMLDYLLTLNGIELDQQDRLGWSALHRCAKYGAFDQAVRLLQAGASPNMRTRKVKRH